MSLLRKPDSPARAILATAIGFAGFYFLDESFFRRIYDALNESTQLVWPSHTIAYLIVGIPIFLATLVIAKPSQAIPALGLNGNPIKGIAATLFFTSPMLIGYALSYPLSDTITPSRFGLGCINAAFFEELYFRAFLFGFLFRFTRLGFLPAIAVGALIFALGHSYQSQDPAILFGILATTFFGAIFFAWLYVEWDYNIWIPIGQHFFMNFSWMLFAVDDTALGSQRANLFRLATIALSIIGTILIKRRLKKPLTIRGQAFWKSQASR